MRASHINPAISEETWRKIVTLFEQEGVTAAALAKRFGVTSAAIYLGLKKRNAKKPAKSGWGQRVGWGES